MLSKIIGYILFILASYTFFSYDRPMMQNWEFFFGWNAVVIFVLFGYNGIVMLVKVVAEAISGEHNEF
jgi:uncharacterized membrane protein SirB2